jgi:DNA processing protein
MDARERRAWLTLLLAPGVGPTAGMRLLQAFGGAATALEAGRAAWRAAGVPDALHDGLRKPDAEAMRNAEAWLDGGDDRQLIALDDPRYPTRLIETARPPLALFCIGDPAALMRPQLAIVGSRRASAQGLIDAEAFSGALAQAGLCITSGLAQGIDGAAHAAAIDAGGQTIAVCGTGPDRVYPARHRDLAHRIASAGALVTEFPPGTPPLPEHFPRRNRIIAGLSLGVLVIEAAARSGSLITARLAGEQNRDVFAIPGSIHYPGARGCHALIRDGATLVETARDVLVVLAPHLEAPPGDGKLATLAETRPTPAMPRLSAVAGSTLSALGDAPVAFDALLSRSGLSVDQLSTGLLELELAGVIASQPGGTFMRLHRAAG